VLGFRYTTERVQPMQARYENCDGTISFGEIVGFGKFPWKHGYLSAEQVTMRATVQIRFDGQDAEHGERVESLFADDKYLTLGVLTGSMASTLAR